MPHLPGFDPDTLDFAEKDVFMESCISCDGTGEADDGSMCDECSGTGVASNDDEDC